MPFHFDTFNVTGTYNGVATTSLLPPCVCNALLLYWAAHTSRRSRYLPHSLTLSPPIITVFREKQLALDTRRNSYKPAQNETETEKETGTNVRNRYLCIID